MGTFPPAFISWSTCTYINVQFAIWLPAQPYSVVASVPVKICIHVDQLILSDWRFSFLTLLIL